MPVSTESTTAPRRLLALFAVIEGFSVIGLAAGIAFHRCSRG